MLLVMLLLLMCVLHCRHFTKSVDLTKNEAGQVSGKVTGRLQCHLGDMNQVAFIFCYL